MQPEKSSRIDIVELKTQMLKKIGPDRFKRYFNCLNKFISQNLSKSDFDKSCYRILGRENLSLHNQIIKSILRNACSSKTAPPAQVVGLTNLARATVKSSQAVEDGHGHGGVSLNNLSSVAPVLSNGAVLSSPRKVRSGIRDRKPKDRPSPLGPNGKTVSVSHEMTTTEDSGAKVVENGNAVPCDYQRPIQHMHELAELPENEQGLRIKKSVEPSVGKGQSSIRMVEVGEEVEQANHLRSPLIAPLGIPFCSASIGGGRKTVPVASCGDFVSCYDSGALAGTDAVRKRMEQIAAVQGLGGVSMECANMLNNMVDVYLKQLIRSCVALVGTSSANNTIKSPVQKQVMHGKLINSPWPSNHLHVQSGPVMAEEKRDGPLISLHDFKVAMELNPQQLGEDWPLLLEKISMQVFEE